MTIGKFDGERAVLSEIGARIERLRLERNWTQAYLAGEAGVGVRTLQRLEAGEVSSQLSSLIRILRVLEMQERWDIFIPPPEPSPVEMAKMRGKQRRRASGETRGADFGSVRETPTKWTWGE
jgi:transcriptional regulator with XRE-family HTH domain